MPAQGLTTTWGAEEWSKYILDHLTTASVLLRSGARGIPITGRVAHVPRTLTDGTASWTAEGTEITSSAPTADELVLTPKALKNVVALSNESVADAPVDELQAVGDALVRSIGAALDTKALSADAATATAPAGLLSLALTAQTGGTTSLDSYISAAGKIQSVGGLPGAIYLNANDMTTLRLVKGGTGLNSYVLQPDAQAAGAEKLAGCTFYPTPALPAGTAVVADPSQIVVGVRQDAEVQFSVDQRFSADSTMARVVCRVDVGVNDFRGVVKVTV